MLAVDRAVAALPELLRQALCAAAVIATWCIGRVDIAEMVHDDVQDDRNTVLVGLVHETSQLLCRAEARIHSGGVRGAVAVVGACVLQQRRDPQGLHAEVLEIAEPVADALDVTAMPPVRQLAEVTDSHGIDLILRHVEAIVGQVAIVEAVNLDFVHDDAHPGVGRGTSPQPGGAVGALALLRLLLRPGLHGRDTNLRDIGQLEGLRAGTVRQCTAEQHRANGEPHRAHCAHARPRSGQRGSELVGAAVLLP
mmetsp:Transcript_8857/g.22818  ORF Transcript_8857/g.22818 Transcript_8857/m.22818 type:complete len:252 (+) Transcript_8857:1781-2536(+)